MQYTEKQLADLIANVEQVFTAQLAKAENMSLTKSEDGEEDHKEKKEEHKEEESEHEEAPKHEAKDDESEEHEEGNEHEGHDYDAEDMEHMEKMYRSMSKGELAAHHGCIQKCMGKSEAKPAEMEKAEKPKNMEDDGHKNGGEMSASEPKDTPGAKSEASKAEGMQMEKSENQEVELLKSELSAQKAKFEAVQEFLTKLAKKTAPQGKAITSLDVIAKSEIPNEEKSLTKAQITEILNSKTADPSLKKSDRDAVTSYYLNGQLNINSISHLLK